MKSHDKMEKALEALIWTIEATGGIQIRCGQKVPVVDPDWIDLADSYLLACEAMGKEPMYEH